MLDKKVANVKHGHIVYTIHVFRISEKGMKNESFPFLFAEKGNQRKKVISYKKIRQLNCGNNSMLTKNKKD